MSLKVSTRHKGGDFYLQISVSWQVFKTRCLSSRNQFLLDILQWQILLSISLKHIRKLLLNYLLEQVKATSGQRMTRETSWYTPATSALPEGHLSGDLWGTSTQVGHKLTPGFNLQDNMLHGYWPRFSIHLLIWGYDDMTLFNIRYLIYHTFLRHIPISLLRFWVIFESHWKKTQKVKVFPFVCLGLPGCSERVGLIDWGKALTLLR